VQTPIWRDGQFTTIADWLEAFLNVQPAATKFLALALADRYRSS
jgi:hypothetical protein